MAPAGKEAFEAKPMASPTPLILAGASTAQMLVLKKLKDLTNAGRPPLPNMPLVERLVLGSAGLCAIGGIFSALGILRFDKLFGKRNLDSSSHKV